MEHEADGVAAVAAGARTRSGRQAVSRGGASPAGRSLGTALTSAIEQQRGEGRPLPGAVRRRLEPALGVDLGAVRLHDGRPADELAVRLDAEAFTVGPDVFVRGQRDLTASDEGRQVLAHELSHVAQQHGGPAVVQRLPRPKWLKRLARRFGSRGATGGTETPYQPIPAFAPESPYQPIPGFPGGDRPHRFSGAYGVPIPARVDDEPEGGHYNTIPNFDDEPEGGHYNTIPNFDDEPEGGHYNTIPNFDDEPEGGHYNTIPNFDDEPEGGHYNTIPNFDDEPEGGHYNNIPDFGGSPGRLRSDSGPYGVPLPASQQEMARRLAEAAAKKKKVRKRVRFAE